MARTYTDYVTGSTAYQQNQKLERFHFVDDSGFDWSLVSPLVQYSGNVGSVVIQDTQLAVDNVPLEVARGWLVNPVGPMTFFGGKIGYAAQGWKGPAVPFRGIAFSAPAQNSYIFIFPSTLYPGRYTLNGLTAGAVQAEVTAIQQTQRDASVFSQILSTVAYTALAASIVAAVSAATATAAASSEASSAAVDVAPGAIPETIAAPVTSSGIPEYIAAGTLPAPLPVDAALATDATSIGLVGGAADAGLPISLNDAAHWAQQQGEQLAKKTIIGALAPAKSAPASDTAAPAPTPATPAPSFNLFDYFVDFLWRLLSPA